MSTPRQETHHDPTADSLWLEVQQNDERWFFELRATDDAAITVGSHPSAQIHIVSPGVAATHFHFERERSELVAVPGYRAGLRINAVKAPGPTRLSEHAIIDFCAVSLQINIHRARPENFRGHVSRRSSTPAEYLRALPGEGDVTGIALPAAPPLPTFSSFDTMEAAVPRFRTEGLVPLGAAPLPNVNPALGPQGTVVMRVVRLEPEPEPLPAPPVATPLPAFDFSRTERIPVVKIAPESTEPASPDSTPTRVEVPAPRRSSAPPHLAASPSIVTPTTPSTPLGVVVPIRIEPSAPVAPVIPARMVLPEPAASMKTADFDVAAMAPFLVTPASGLAPAPAPAALVPRLPAPSEPAPSVKTIPAPTETSRLLASRTPAWLVALGRSAQQRPLRVAAAALGGSVVLALALVGAARLTSGDARPRARETLTNPSAALPSSSVPPHSAGGGAATTQAAVPEASAALPPADPKQLVEAMTHLTSGRYTEAEVAYRAIANAKPTSPAYAGIADMLERSRSPHCRQKPLASGCPEVIP